MRNLPLVLALGLVACGRADAPAADTEATSPAVEGNLAQMTRYTCPDGSFVDAAYPDTDSADVTFNGRTIAMKVTPSASGARYVGDGWEWWTEGATEGTLSPLQPGEDIATGAGVICTVR